MLVRVPSELIGEAVSRSSPPASLRIASLDHEVGNHPMKRGSVVELPLTEKTKLFCSPSWALLSPKRLHDDLAAGGVERRGVLLLAVDGQGRRTGVLFRHAVSSVARCQCWLRASSEPIFFRIARTSMSIS